MEQRLSAIGRKLTATGQDHVLGWWGRLDGGQRERLLTQLEGLDWKAVAHFRELVGAGSRRAARPEEVEVPEVVGAGQDDARRQEARLAGEGLLKAGQVAVVTAAGGQGTRLGFCGPKGTFAISPVKNKSIFQLHAEKIRALAARSGRPLPWYIMTSDTNDEATREYFRVNHYLGLRAQDIQFFRQGMAPAMDAKGQLVMDRPWHVFEAPNGHGGTFDALMNSGMIDDMESRGIEEVFYFQVDNVLIRIADPIFMGLHRLARAQMSSKVCPKRDPEEKVGVTVLINGRVHVIEYSDLPDELCCARNAQGQLKFDAGNIAIHAFRVDFVRELADEGLEIPWHVAHKKVTCLDQTDEPVEPTRPNAYKFEHFIFDALPMAARVVLMEVDRRDEFAPVKQQTGEDSVVTAVEAMMEQWARWLTAVDVRVPRDDRGRPAYPLEISPLVALEEQDLFGKVGSDTVIEGPFYLGPA